MTRDQQQQAAARYVGTVERLSQEFNRHHILGFVRADCGCLLAFRRNEVMNHRDPSPAWWPEPGDRVGFARELRMKGPWAIRVRKLDAP